jgi:hypothetical protein
MRKKTIIRSSIAIAMLAAVFVLIGSVLASNKKKNAEKTAVVAQTTTGDVAVKVSSVEKQVAGMDFSANGNFAPAQQLNFAAENSCYTGVG